MAGEYKDLPPVREAQGTEPGRIEKQPERAGTGVTIGRTHPGEVRELNEDAFVVSGTKETASYSLDGKEEERNGLEEVLGAIEKAGARLSIVADGMGGHAAGEKASALAIREIADSLAKVRNWGKLVSEKEREELSEEEQERLPARRAKEVLERAVQNANDKLFKYNQDNREDSGTTITLALLVDNKAYIANVGDSRTYLVEKDGSLEQITIDHSLVERLIATGQITREEARAHPQRNVVYRSLGNKPTVEVDIFARELEPGQRLLLCSDGLNGKLADEEMVAVIKREGNAAQICGRLINAANQAGGEDNISVILASPEKRPFLLSEALKGLAAMVRGEVELDEEQFVEWSKIVWDTYLEGEELGEDEFKIIVGLLGAARRRGIKITLTRA